MDGRTMEERIIKAESRIDRHDEVITKLERNTERAEEAIRKLTEQVQKQGWILTTAGMVLIASQSGVFSQLGKVLLALP